MPIILVPRLYTGMLTDDPSLATCRHCQNNMQQSTKRGKERLLVIANRLPVIINQEENGQFDFKMASGGLVSALQSLSKAMTFQWFGWPGTEIHKNDQATVKDQLATRFHAVPVFLSQQTIKSYYSGFSSESLISL